MTTPQSISDDPPPARDQVRKSVTLTGRDLRDLDVLRRSPTALAVVGATEGLTEAALLHLLLVHSLRQAVEAAEAAGYEALAASFQHDPQERALRAQLRARRRVRADVEEDVEA